MRRERWNLRGAEGEAILGDVDLPEGEPRAVLLLAHGFKGYKDYGMFPVLGRAMAETGAIAHRFNFSHAGMTRNVETFERPDLFQRDTWNKQIEDLRTVARAVERGTVAGRGLPVVFFGHSRGGVTVLLACGRDRDDDVPRPAGIVTASAPDRTNSFSDEERQELLGKGSIPSPSSRTGQTLRVGRAFLQEQLDDPAGHDVLALVAKIEAPILVVHGSDDETVPPDAARSIARAAKNARLVLVEGANHVFNTPNPAPADRPPSRELGTLIDAMRRFVDEIVGD